MKTTSTINPITTECMEDLIVKTCPNYQLVKDRCVITLHFQLFKPGARLVYRNCFPKRVSVFVCLYAYLFVFPHPREQTFYLKLESSLYTINKG